MALPPDKEPSYTKKITAYPWESTLEQIDALARQRRREQPADLQRLAMSIGALFISIQGERGPDGKYGLWSDTMIQEQIRSWVAIGDDWLAEQGRPLHSRRGDGSLAPFPEVLTPRGSSMEGVTFPSGERFSTLANGSLAGGKSENDARAEAKDFVLDAAIGADLNLDDNEIL
jgi:hypothetical protein